MSSDVPSANGESAANGRPPKPALPPVEAPSARFILQLFLVPGIIVAVIVGFVWLFFGWIGAGPQTPEEFLRGLKDGNELKRWKTAQDLSQILPRKQQLRTDAGFAMDLAVLMQAEMQKRPAGPAANNSRSAPDLMEFLPAVLGHFDAPVAVDLFCKLIEDNLDAVDQSTVTEGGRTALVVNVAGLRVRNAAVALGILGAQLREFDRRSMQEKQKILSDLDDLAAQPRFNAEQQGWARHARRYLNRRMARPADAVASPSADDSLLEEKVASVLAKAVRGKDEMTVKYAIVALANWSERLMEPVLYEAANPQQPLQLAFTEDGDVDRARREIRYNAVLALARRRSSLTPWSYIVHEILTESTLRSRYQTRDRQVDETMVARIQIKALHDLQEMERTQPGKLKELPEVVEAVKTLASSSNPAVQVEARKLLGAESLSGKPPLRVSREVLILVGVGVGVLFLLALAAISRWRRKPASAGVAAPPPPAS